MLSVRHASFLLRWQRQPSTDLGAPIALAKVQDRKPDATYSADLPACPRSHAPHQPLGHNAPQAPKTSTASGTVHTRMVGSCQQLRGSSFGDWSVLYSEVRNLGTFDGFRRWPICHQSPDPCLWRRLPCGMETHRGSKMLCRVTNRFLPSLRVPLCY